VYSARSFGFRSSTYTDVCLVGRRVTRSSYDVHVDVRSVLTFSTHCVVQIIMYAHFYCE